MDDRRNQLVGIDQGGRGPRGRRRTDRIVRHPHTTTLGVHNEGIHATHDSDANPPLLIRYTAILDQSAHGHVRGLQVWQVDPAPVPGRILVCHACPYPEEPSMFGAWTAIPLASKY